MSNRFRDTGYKTKWVLCLLWGMPWAAAGLLLFATIVFAPVGLLAFTVAGLPLSRVEINHMRRKAAWENRDRPMSTTNEMPWILEFESDEPDA